MKVFLTDLYSSSAESEFIGLELEGEEVKWLRHILGGKQTSLVSLHFDSWRQLILPRIVCTREKEKRSHHTWCYFHGIC